MVLEQGWLRKMEEKFSPDVELKAEKDLLLLLVESNQLKPLRRRSDFESLKSQGKKLKLEPWLLLVYKKNRESSFRLGFSLNSKFINSIKRNRFKRLVREHFRQSYGLDSTTYDLLFIITKKITNEDWIVFNNKSWKKHKSLFTTHF